MIYIIPYCCHWEIEKYQFHGKGQRIDIIRIIRKSNIFFYFLLRFGMNAFHWIDSTISVFVHLFELKPIPYQGCRQCWLQSKGWFNQMNIYIRRLPLTVCSLFSMVWRNVIGLFATSRLSLLWWIDRCQKNLILFNSCRIKSRCSHLFVSDAVTVPLMVPLAFRDLYKTRPTTKVNATSLSRYWIKMKIYAYS